MARNETEFGDQYTYECIDAYRPLSNLTVTCSELGDWSEIPVCERK